MSIRLMIVCGGAAWGACVSGHLTDTSGASIPKAQVTLESQSARAGETNSAEDGNFRICTDVLGEYRIVAKSSGFQRRTTPAFELQRDLDLGALAMRIDMDIVVCKFPISPEPDPLLDTSGDFVRFTGRDGKRRKFPRKPIDRQHNLDSEWKRVVFLRGNEIWVNDRRVYTHTAAMWAPEFAPDGKSIRVWSTTWKDGDSQFSVPIQGR